MRWDFPTHAGGGPELSFSQGKREVVEMNGRRPETEMHHARRGGHKSAKKTPPADIACYIQGFLSSITLKAGEMNIAQPSAKAK